MLSFIPFSWSHRLIIDLTWTFKVAILSQFKLAIVIKILFWDQKEVINWTMYQSKHALYEWSTRLFLPRPHHEGGTMSFLLNWTFLDNFCSIKGWCFKSPCSSEITAKDQSHSENDWDWEWLMTENTALWIKLTNTNYCLKKDCPTK